ncbi:MAG: Hemolysin-type calcium-binding region, partial [Caulobacter sp.]|nr:Hemolysin-type calcium-binding region [Caulobacter sp.]
NDIYFVDDAGDTITDSSGIDTVKSTLTHTLGADFEHLTLLGSGDINGTGNASNNTITGNDGVNILLGMDGADKLYGMGGKDNIDGGTGADVIDGGDANDIIHGGADNDTATGGAGNDSLWGDDGNDQLDGGDGADKLYGGAGLDKLTGGIGNDYMYGGDGTDTLTGGDGNDMLDGEIGPDKLYGGAGNDVYIVNEYNDVVVENLGEGYDVVRSSAATYTMGDNLEALELIAGAGDIFGTGNDLANTITGNEGVNVLDGRGGVDTIRGNDGNDVIIGGTGNDLLYGGSGWDVFAVRQESVSLATLETDRIYDLDIAGGDRVDLSAIDANANLAGNQAFTFATVLSTFSGAAGEATLTYDAGTDTTYLKLDVNGDKKADYMLRVNGDVTGTSGDVIAPGSFLDGTGGWIL